MQRRCLLLACITVPVTRAAHAVPVVATLSALAAAFLAGAKWSADLVGTLDSAWERGERLIGRVEARRLKEDVQRIGAASADLKLGRALVIDEMDRYLAAPHPELWLAIRERTERLAVQADALMRDTQGALGPRIGASAAYGAFLEHTGRRLELVQQLSTLPPPVSDGELKALAEMNDAQKELQASYAAVLAALERLAV